MHDGGTQVRPLNSSETSQHEGDELVGQGIAPRGSQRWLQLAVNRCPEVLDEPITRALDLPPGESIHWLSPLESDGFTEYRDRAFLDLLGVDTPNRRLEEFWPRGGPVWDGLARTSGGRCLLVEAKANISEFDSSPTAASEASLFRIKEAIEETRAFLRVRSGADWTRCFYQYANRLAHLYFLRELNGIGAALVFVYFTGDTTVPGREPVSRDGWEAAIGLATHHLRVPTNTPWMRENVVDVFIDGSITRVVGKLERGIEIERTGLNLGQTQTRPGRRPVQCR